MELALIKLELKRLQNIADSILELFVEPHSGLSKEDNLELIKRGYSAFKGDLDLAVSDFKKKETKSLLNEAEAVLWLPAINEALLHLKERKGSTNELKLHECLYDCSFTLGHYHSQIDV